MFLEVWKYTKSHLKPESNPLYVYTYLADSDSDIVMTGIHQDNALHITLYAFVILVQLVKELWVHQSQALQI